MPGRSPLALLAMGCCMRARADDLPPASACGVVTSDEHSHQICGACGKQPPGCHDSDFCATPHGDAHFGVRPAPSVLSAPDGMLRGGLADSNLFVPQGDGMHFDGDGDYLTVKDFPYYGHGDYEDVDFTVRHHRSVVLWYKVACYWLRFA